jgi:hypothetical protein
LSQIEATASNSFPRPTWSRAQSRDISQLIEPRSPTERHGYQGALRKHHSYGFDMHSELYPGARDKILQVLKSTARATKSALSVASTVLGRRRGFSSRNTGNTCRFLRPWIRGAAFAATR